jgi:hypothetical protein
MIFLPEKLVQILTQDLGQTEAEVQCRIIVACLKQSDCLSGNPNFLSQFFLGQVFGNARYLYFAD